MQQRLRNVGFERAFWVGLVATHLALLASGCTESGEPPESRGDVVQCVPELPYHEKKRRCDEQFSICLDSHIQSIPSGRFGHSQCWSCKDVCMQSNGNWPDSFDGKPCR